MATLEEMLRDQNQPPSKLDDKKLGTRSTLEKALEEDDSALASELNRSRAEEIIANRRTRINQMNRVMVRSQEQEERDPARGQSADQSMTDIAQGLLEKGMDPVTVGKMIDYMIARQSGGYMPFPGAPAPGGQGLTITDVLNLVDRLNSNKTPDPTLTNILSKLTDDMKELKDRVNNPPPPPGAVMVQQPDGTFIEMGRAEKTIVIPRPAAPSTGASIEELKEKNRHDEAVKKLDDDKQHHERMGEILGDGFERIGAGIAEWAGSKAEAGSKAVARTEPKSQQMQNIECPDCKAHFQAPVGVKKVVCPQCKTELNDE